MKIRLRFALAIGLACWLGAPAVWAQAAPDSYKRHLRHPGHPGVVAQNSNNIAAERPESDRRTQSEAASIARRQTGGRVLDVSRRSVRGREGYQVKVYVDGKIRKVFVDDDK